MPFRAKHHPANDRPTVRILGTHGVPANYGGFETAAENVALFLRDQGWRVIVYCQQTGAGQVTEDQWRGIERVNVPVMRSGWLGTTTFDLRSIRHATRQRDLCLTFGYNTAVFNIWQRLRGVPNVINMDGIEWSRSRWGKLRQAVLYINERIACYVGNHLIADHPRIKIYLSAKARPSKISTITYGANPLLDVPSHAVTARGLVPGRYSTLICRPIPENSILELVQGFSSERRGHQLVIFGDYQPDKDPYHRAVTEAASDEVTFVGAVYDPDEVAALRFHGVLYLHGHTVGGTNPSLVEAMAAGNAIVAHDNEYNRWVAGDGALYFSTASEAAQKIGQLLSQPHQLATLQAASRTRQAAEFTWKHVAGQYETLLTRYLKKGTAR
jgi:glycosyltransferase involved in cell wall biosynthesis